MVPEKCYFCGRNYDNSENYEFPDFSKASKQTFVL
jgi:hypothetical protein